MLLFALSLVWLRNFGHESGIIRSCQQVVLTYLLLLILFHHKWRFLRLDYKVLLAGCWNILGCKTPTWNRLGHHPRSIFIFHYSSIDHQFLRLRFWNSYISGRHQWLIWSHSRGTPLLLVLSRHSRLCVYQKTTPGRTYPSHASTNSSYLVCGSFLLSHCLG